MIWSTQGICFLKTLHGKLTYTIYHGFIWANKGKYPVKHLGNHLASTYLTLHACLLLWEAETRLHGVWWCSYHPNVSRGTSRAELAPAPGTTLLQGSVKKRCWGEPLLPWTMGLHHPGLQSSLCWKMCPALTLLCSASPPCRVKEHSPERGNGAAAPSGAGLAVGQAAGQAAEPAQRQPALPFIASTGRWTRIFIFSELVF